MKIPQKTSAGLPYVNFSSSNLHTPPILIITFKTSSQTTAAFEGIGHCRNSTNSEKHRTIPRDPNKEWNRPNKNKTWYGKKNNALHRETIKIPYFLKCMNEKESKTLKENDKGTEYTVV